MPNLRRNARGRPHSLQRLCLRELNFGFRASFTLFAVVAINPQCSMSCAHSRRFSRRLKPEPRNVFSSALSERHAERLEQRARRVVVLRSRYDRDVHTLQLFDLRIVDLREDQLIAQSERVVPAAIETLGRNSAEVADARKSS